MEPKNWWLNGNLHRDDGAAIKYPNGDEGWYQHGKLHRDDGPAIEYYNDDDAKEWWLNDAQYANATAWAEAVLKLHNKPHAADDAERFPRVILTKEDLL
jgi:hypothetical protein